jgi:ADP-ribosylglycohydrolase
MLGAIAGDIIGSVYEGSSPGFKEFVLFSSRATFTDDTVLTVAVGSALLHGRDYESELLDWGRRYPSAGYGYRFSNWLADPQRSPRGSFGNGSAMRVSPIGWAVADLEEVVVQARASAIPSHDHPEGIRGAQAVAAAVHAARHGATKARIAEVIAGYGYDCTLTLEQQRERGWVGVTCRETVPAAAVAFLAATDFEDAVRIAVSLGGDTDTTACITGAIAEAYYGGVPPAIEQTVRDHLDATLLEVVDRFRARFVT